MKATVSVETHLCDVCKAQTYPYVCLRCGKEFCYECSKKEALTFRHAVYFQGGGDGLYCKPCVVILGSTATGGPDPLFVAFCKVRDLRLELEAYTKGFEARREQAEKELERIPRGKYGQ